MPDIFVPIDTSSYPGGVNRLFYSSSYNNFVYTYYLRNKTQIDQYKSAGDYARNFDKAGDIWREFTKYARLRDSVNLNILTPVQEATLQRRLEASLSRFRWRNNGYFQVLNDEDAVVRKALEVIKKQPA